jgi:Cytochrome P450.
MAVCSILYQLATRQEEQEKIHEELLRVLPSVDTPLTSRHLDQMQYLRAFVKEVFRYRPHQLQLTELFQFLSLRFTKFTEKNEIIWITELEKKKKKLCYT